MPLEGEALFTSHIKLISPFATAFSKGNVNIPSPFASCTALSLTSSNGTASFFRATLATVASAKSSRIMPVSFPPHYELVSFTNLRSVSYAFPLPTVSLAIFTPSPIEEAPPIR